MTFTSYVQSPLVFSMLFYYFLLKKKGGVVATPQLISQPISEW